MVVTGRGEDLAGWEPRGFHILPSCSSHFIQETGGQLMGVTNFDEETAEEMGAG
jgi:hypothetical protein